MNYIMKEIDRHGLWELAVLCFLRESPMHPYEMQRLLLERHWDEVLVLKRGSLYHAIKRLLKSKLITVIGTSRDGLRPERTTYRMTPSGEEELVRWLREMVSVPLREPSVFMASINFLIHLPPSDAIAQLENRAQRLEAEIGSTDVALKQAATFVPRYLLLEGEYLLWMRKAELQWVRNLVDELRSGKLTWDLKRIFQEIEAARTAAAKPAKGGTTR